MTERYVPFRRTPKPWKILNTRRVVALDEVRLFEDDLRSINGSKKARGLRLFLNDFSIIVPLLGSDRIVFEWNYRHATGGWELELPAGMIEDHERPEVCARRELREETGYSARSLERLGWVNTLPGITGQRAFVYLARNLKKGKAHPEPFEALKIRVLRVKDAYRLARAGRIVHSPTVTALCMAEKSIRGRE